MKIIKYAMIASRGKGYPFPRLLERVYASLWSVLNECPLDIQHPQTPSANFKKICKMPSAWLRAKIQIKKEEKQYQIGFPFYIFLGLFLIFLFRLKQFIYVLFCRLILQHFLFCYCILLIKLLFFC